MSFRFRMKQVIKRAMQTIVLPVCYDLGCLQKRDPNLVVFADAHHNSLPSSMRLLHWRLKKKGIYRIAVTCLDYETASPLAVARHSMSFMVLYARSGTIIICDNFLPVSACRKRRDTRVIQLWHACGCYKKFGYDASDDIPEGYRGGNVYKNTDIVTVSGEAAVKPFSSAMRLNNGQVRALGVSRTDLYFSKRWRHRCARDFYLKYPGARGKKVVLWAPTFRGNAAVPRGIFLDIRALHERLGKDYMVLAHLHPHMRNMLSRNDIDYTQKQKESTHGWPSLLSGRMTKPGRLPAADNKYFCQLPIEELYPVIDVLITDYSSIIYEYLLFKKGLVLYVPDLEEYKVLRGFYMDIEKIPGMIVTKEMDLAQAIVWESGNHALNSRRCFTGGTEKEPDPLLSRGVEIASETQERGPSASRGLQTQEETEDREKFLNLFLKRYMGACDGRATERIASLISVK